MRSEGLTKVGHEADNRDIPKNRKELTVFFFLPDTDQVAPRLHDNFQKMFLGGAIVLDMISINEWGKLWEYRFLRVMRRPSV